MQENSLSAWPEIPGVELQAELGRGGMAVVYRGIQTRLKRQVAVKVLSPVLLVDPQFSTRFLREAETAAGLNHSNIVSIYDVGSHGQWNYMVMEYLPRCLAAEISSGPLEPERALMVFKSIAAALAYAHLEGIVHRDVKPDNILFRVDGTPVLCDFGIAKAVGSATRLTKTGMSVGTPHYMSPEQARGRKVDGRSDLYSLGVVLFEMLTGKLPFEAEDSVAVAIAHVQDPVPRLPGQLVHYQSLLDKLLAKDPDQRSFDLNEAISETLVNSTITNEPRIIRGTSASTISHDVEAEAKTEILSDKNEEGVSDEEQEIKMEASSRSKLPTFLAASLVVCVAALILYVLFKPHAETIDVIETKVRQEAAEKADSIQLRSMHSNLLPENFRQELERWNLFCRRMAWNEDYANPEGNYSGNFQESRIGGIRVVIDHFSGLIWMDDNKYFSGKFVLNEVKNVIARINRANLAGYHDWRLPTVVEAMSLMSARPLHNKEFAYLDSVFSYRVPWIWTADVAPGFKQWAVYYSEGYASPDPSDSVAYLRIVRSK